MGMVKNIAVNAELSHTLLFLTTVFFGIVGTIFGEQEIEEILHLSRETLKR